MTYDLWRDEFAEAMYYFVGQPIIWEDFCQKSIEEDLSIAEYVVFYKQTVFISYCLDKFPSLLEENATK